MMPFDKTCSTAMNSTQLGLHNKSTQISDINREAEEQQPNAVNSKKSVPKRQSCIPDFFAHKVNRQAAFNLDITTLENIVIEPDIDFYVRQPPAWRFFICDNDWQIYEFEVTSVADDLTVMDVTQHICQFKGATAYEARLHALYYKGVKLHNGELIKDLVSSDLPLESFFYMDNLKYDAEIMELALKSLVSIGHDEVKAELALRVAGNDIFDAMAILGY